MSKCQLGATVKELRELKGWSVRELGRVSGTSASLVSRMESANDWNVTIDNLDRIAQALGLTAGELLSYEPRQRIKCEHCNGRGWLFSKEQKRK